MTYTAASPGQRLVHRRLQVSGGDPGTELAYRLRLVGNLEIARLEQAIGTLAMSHHTDLFARFHEIGGALVKQLGPVPSRFLSCVNTAPDATVTRLSSGQLWHFRLYRAHESCHFLDVSFSHLVFDGACWELFVVLLQRYYNGYDTTSPPELVKTAFEGVAVQSDERDEVFWRKHLKGRALGQHLSFQRASMGPSATFVSAKGAFSGADFERLSELRTTFGATLFQIVAAALAVTIARYGDLDDPPHGLTIGHTVSTRAGASALGCFINVVPLFVDMPPGCTPRELVEQIKAERAAVRPHQHYPLDRLLAVCDEQATRGRPVLNLILNESEGLLPASVPMLEGLRVDLVRTPDTGGPFDLGLTYALASDGLRFSLDAPARNCSVELLVELAQNIERTLCFFSDQPDGRIEGLLFDQAQLPVAEGGRAPDKPDIVARIIQHAVAGPDRVAVRCADRVLSYGVLVEEARSLARRIAQGVAPSSLEAGIGLLLGRSEWLPLSMLTAMMLRVPFIPLDPTLPAERLAAMRAATGLCCVLCDDSAKTISAAWQVSGTTVFRLAEVIRSEAGTAPDHEPDAVGQSELAYVMFTSGSTGVPKGVAIGRANLANFLVSMEFDPSISAADDFLALTPICFDISILELLGPLFVGGRLEIIDDTTRRSAMALAMHLNACTANVVQATPSTWRMLRNAGWAANRTLKLLCGGEALSTELAAYLLGQGHTLFNMYGPTETTIWSSVMRVTEPGIVSLGKPVLGAQYFIIDRDLHSVPLGHKGELAIAGACVGHGYLNHSNDCFVTLPGTTCVAYRTGDLVRAYGASDIVYLGRADSQTKFNGHRVELEEICACARISAPNAAFVAVLREVPAQHLCLFYQLPDNESLDEARVRTVLRGALPSYMVPDAIHRLASYPLTPGGKTDTKRLRRASLEELCVRVGAARLGVPAGESAGDAFVTMVASIMADVLDIDPPEPGTSLSGLGLNSISYNLLSQALDSRMGVRVQPHEFYAFVTVADLAASAKRRKVADPPHAVSYPHAQGGSLVEASPEIAIVGYAVRMPGGLEAAPFWSALLRGENLVSAELRSGFRRPLHAGFLPDIAGFDARFFSISPLEANQMDPRQRLLLETAWRAVEDAGYAARTLAGSRIGCYIAATGADYATLQARKDCELNPYSLPGASLSILSNRISSFFDWTGPSFTIDTACSGSLSALVKACRDVASGVCDAALVGGVNIIADDQISRGLERGNFMSPRHRCAAFDAQADGYVRGEGVGCFLIKPLERARLQGDAIHGVILAHGENHGGRANSLTAPSMQAQARLLTETYTPELAQRVSYIETHGTGTKLGDPIEIDALKTAWRMLRGERPGAPIWLGAVKTNIGHLEPAAGLAGLAKVLLAMRGEILPRNIHFQSLNPHIDLHGTPFRLLERNVAWAGERIAGISSFGFGGVNAHVVVGPPPTMPEVSVRGPYLITLSARGPGPLEAARMELLAFVEAQARGPIPLDVGRLSSTLLRGRAHFEYRAAWIVDDAGMLRDLLARAMVVHKAVTPARGLAPEAIAWENRSKALEALKAAYLSGAEIYWESPPMLADKRRMHLPTYRFESKQYWFDRQPDPPPYGAISTRAGMLPC